MSGGFCAECGHATRHVVLLAHEGFCRACQLDAGRMIARLYALLEKNEEIQVCREDKLLGEPVGVSVLDERGEDLAAAIKPTLAEAFAHVCRTLERRGRRPRR